ncbi:DNA-binding HTH domain-containing protein [Candidatus Regiella insecticola]|uniref:DNA-binding HTH domain-containing protein n=1 Tax=Candidatus Regiella insecticola TaxID=138073 RepID=A0A6L2ZS25_9ENTR|nr:DNA-binding HTH domain-containing protein [Candidatus Regiella insecticola]
MKEFYIGDFSPYCGLFPELSQIQLKVFVMYSYSVSPNRIAIELNITVNTFYSYIKIIKSKYNVKSSSELRNIFYVRKDFYLLNMLHQYTQLHISKNHTDGGATR